MSGDAGVLAVDAAVIARYRIGQVLSTQVLRGGMFLRPLLLDTTSGKYVLRAHTFRNTAEAFRFQAETLEGLAGSGQRCPRVVRDQQGCVGQSGAGVFWALHEYLEGRQYDWTGWRRAMRDAAFVRQLGVESLVGMRSCARCNRAATCACRHGSPRSSFPGSATCFANGVMICRI